MMLFYRSGREFNGTPQTSETGKPFTMSVYRCNRCGGAGGADKWRSTGWTCFDCGGSGKGSPKVEKLYTREQLDKLNALQAKRDAKRAAAQAAKNAERAAKAAEVAAKFDTDYAALLASIPAAVLEADALVRDVIDRGRLFGSLSEKQVALVQSVVERAAAQAKRVEGSRYVGSIGERVKGIEVTCVNVASFERVPFGSYGRYTTETVYICSFESVDGITYVTKSPGLSAERGARGVLTGTIKEHSEFKGVKQNVLQRAKFETKGAA